MIAETPPHQVDPQSVQVWIEEKEEGYSMLEKRLISWLEKLQSSEDLFKKHVYENPDMGDGDLRQHRFRIYALMAEGEAMAFELLRLGMPADTKNHVALIDQKVRGLWDVLHAWHGAIEDQKDIPESFKKGLADIEAGKVVDMERALNDKP